VAFQPAVLNDDILTLGIASFAEPLAECGYTTTAGRGIGHPGVDEPDDRHRWLLRVRRERPRGRAAEQRDERAAFHWITSRQARRS
jgi:hypothetical protein